MADTARRLARALAAGEPLGQALVRHVEATRLKQVTAAGLCFCARARGDLVEADRLLYAGLGTDNDTGVDALPAPAALAQTHARSWSAPRPRPIR